MSKEKISVSEIVEMMIQNKNLTRKSTEARNSFKHVTDDESVYAAAKYSKKPQ